MADQIVLVQPLHDDDDGASLLVVLPAIEGVIVPIVGGSSLRFGERLFGFERVIDNDDIGAAPGQRATVRAGDPVPLAGGDELLHGLAVWRQAGWKNAPIPLAHHDAAAIAGELVGEVLGIADAEELGRGIMPEIPRRKRDRGQQGFEGAGRQINDEPADLALAHCYELGGDDLDANSAKIGSAGSNRESSAPRTSRSPAAAKRRTRPGGGYRSLDCRSRKMRPSAQSECGGGLPQFTS